MSARSLNLFKVVTTGETGALMERLELSRPPRLLFENRTEIAEVYERMLPGKWSISDSWIPSSDYSFPKAEIISTDCEFTPDFFLLSYEFVSRRFRSVFEKFAEYIEYVDVRSLGSCIDFLEKDYKMAVFASLSPFDRVFRDIAMEYFEKGEYPPKLKVREGFEPVAPIFNLATGPWLMCTEEVVAEIMPHAVSGLSFVNYETDEVLIPGS
jgi:hypothetical protein